MIKADIVADSINSNGCRLTTFVLTYHRFIHAELLTYRMFCLAGDSRLDFELPSGSTKGTRRVYSMTIKDFVDKWENGSVIHKSARHNNQFLSLSDTKEYTVHEIAKLLNLKSASNLNSLCCKGLIKGARKLQNNQWIAPAKSWEEWRNKSTGSRSFSLRSRLSQMLIRQVNEETHEVCLSNVVNVQRSGIKAVFNLKTRNYEITASKDHLILSDRGWVRLEELKIGVDSVLTYKYGTDVKQDPFKKINGIWVCKWTASIRDEIATRQNNKCAETQESLTSDFHIHHIIPKHKRPDLAFDINNVVAVNPEAHRLIHNIQGWQVGTPLQAGFELVESIEFKCDEETFDIEIAGDFPNFFANGVVVHNSRNASSSRAIPVEKNIKHVEDLGLYPLHWGANQKGMQACSEVDDFYKQQAICVWDSARQSMLDHAKELVRLGIHKQVVNRLLEPFNTITTLVTATDYSNFFAQRCHASAQPEIRILAEAMQSAYNESLPTNFNKYGWHLPYISEVEIMHHLDDFATLIKLSVGRCCRVSYLQHDGTRDPEKDIALHDYLVTALPPHLSPFEHIAQNMDDTEMYANLQGWQSRRWKIEHDKIGS